MSKFNPIEDFLTYPSSRTYAVQIKYAKCLGFTRAWLKKGFKESISSCSSYSCPLHRFRPYQLEKFLEGHKIALQHL